MKLNRPLVEINEYAQREGVSVDEIIQCGQIGILQLRKNKGRTYVVDMPVSSYDNSSRIDNEVAQLIGVKSSPAKPFNQNKICHKKTPTIKNFSEKIQKAVKKTTDNFKSKVKQPDCKKQTGEGETEIVNKTNDIPPQPQRKSNIKPGEIKQLVEKMLQKAEQIKTNSPKLVKDHNTEIKKENPVPAVKPKPVIKQVAEIKNEKTTPTVNPAPIQKPTRKKPYVDSVINAMHDQLDDIEKYLNKKIN